MSKKIPGSAQRTTSGPILSLSIFDKNLWSNKVNYHFLAIVILKMVNCVGIMVLRLDRQLRFFGDYYFSWLRSAKKKRNYHKKRCYNPTETSLSFKYFAMVSYWSFNEVSCLDFNYLKLQNTGFGVSWNFAIEVSISCYFYSLKFPNTRYDSLKGAVCGQSLAGNE